MDVVQAMDSDTSAFRPDRLSLTSRFLVRVATQAEAYRMARKLHELRLLRDERSCAETGAGLLVVSQFTLYGDTRKGRRPSWSAAAAPDDARAAVDAVVAALRGRGAPVATGKFGADMRVVSVNDGPFTVIVET